MHGLHLYMFVRSTGMQGSTGCVGCVLRTPRANLMAMQLNQPLSLVVQSRH